MTDLNTALPFRTAGALPSSRTEGLLADALESDDIDVVKHHLIHTWLHYQSLEFALASEDKNAEAIREFVTNHDIDHKPEIEVVTRAYATGILEAAYDVAHETLSDPLFLLGITTAPQSLRTFYPGLDFTDPESEPAIDLDDSDDDTPEA